MFRDLGLRDVGSRDFVFRDLWIEGLGLLGCGFYRDISVKMKQHMNRNQHGLWDLLI